MKKLLSSFVLLLITITVYADVNIRYSTFPDANFRAWLLEQSYGADGVLTDDEIANVTRMKFYGKEIKNLKGIEYFTSIKDLLCNNNQITSLDMSGFMQLDTLYCSNNQITTLNVSGCKSLRDLGCMFNPLISLNVSGCSSLKSLDCGYNSLTSLDISGCTSMRWLNCCQTELESLDATGCTALDTIICSRCQLTSLKLAGGTTVRQTLYCYGNKIKGAAMDSLIASLPDVAIGKMFAIADSEEGNIITTSQVAAANEKGWIVYYMDGAYNWTEYGGSEPVEGIEINATNFPDENFRQYLLEQSYGTDGVLTEDEIAGVTYLSLSGKGIQSLKGIEYFTAMTMMDCNSNQLTTLDVSKNTALVRLECAENQLTSLDLSKNVNMNTLDCFENQLTSLVLDANMQSLKCYGNNLSSLDVSQCTGLKSLNCGSNQLTTLDVSKNTALRWLDCYDNQLTTLDVSKNENLESIDCVKNSIKGNSMTAFVNSLPTVEDGELIVMYFEEEKNVMTTAQVAAAKAKGWTAYSYDKNEDIIEYGGSSDEYLRGDVNGDGIISMPDAMFIIQYILKGKFPDE